MKPRCLVLLASCMIAFGVDAAVTNNHVVLVSIDGLRPEFYLPGTASEHCPTLVRLRETGGHVHKMLPVYPSHTYPGHASLATGVRPSRHEIISNDVILPQHSSPRGFWYASDLKAPALWDVARRAGLTTATVSWPTTAGSKTIDWNIPEFWTTGLGKDIDLIHRHATPKLLDRIEGAIGPMTPDKHKDGATWDAYLAGCAAYILREHKPNLLMVHFGEADKLQHRAGRSAPELPAAMRRLDGHVKRLMDVAAEAGIGDRTTFLVVGDHGFLDVTKSIAPNMLLVREGLITARDRTVLSWKAWVENTGGSAGVYLKDSSDAGSAARVREILEKHARTASGSRLYRLIDGEEVKQRGGPKNALFFLEAEPGYMFSASVAGTNLVRRATLRGNHGNLPETPGVETGLVAAGRGVRKDAKLDTIQMVDVAPTVAFLLGIALEGAEGRMLKELIE